MVTTLSIILIMLFILSICVKVQKTQSLTLQQDKQTYSPWSLITLFNKDLGFPMKKAKELAYYYQFSQLSIDEIIKECLDRKD